MSSDNIFPQDVVDLVRSHVREVQDFPARGVLFRDITPLIADPEGFAALINMLAEKYRGKVDAVAGLESRGFILAAPLAVALGVGMLTVRKAGRLPGPVVGIDYDLEYGSARMELQPFTVEDGQRVLVLDDVLATGGTAGAACDLIRQAGGNPIGLCVLIELTEFNGRNYLGEGVAVDSVLQY
ncbi:adenine phosphoribosyltransferase [Arcanobacterium buesumense]|uniref:Adenine phosphoribosyltransferase n=1 Tax=Arcanobacterium buesumense TaxID=2722751 RepID=A0A6H2EKL0_9ACTO|nr:adenine phosphoribosyltransferase [Arcanobacterium buesumense]QJC21734.1 adenine phosphoribosyltransferase [Arcanobacterium buesumense]